MAACNISQLLADANCFNSCLQVGQWEAIVAQLLCDIRGGDCTVQTLMNESQNFMGLTEGQLWPVITQLTCNWRG